MKTSVEDFALALFPAIRDRITEVTSRTPYMGYNLGTVEIDMASAKAVIARDIFELYEDFEDYWMQNEQRIFQRSIS